MTASPAIPSSFVTRSGVQTSRPELSEENMRLLQTKANGWLTGILICAGVAVLAQTRKTLDMYVIDVEGGGRHGGGAAVLLVAPSGQSLLADTGTGVADVDLVMKAVHDAGITQIDYLVSTHYHSDHV